MRAGVSWTHRRDVEELAVQCLEQRVLLRLLDVLVLLDGAEHLDLHSRNVELLVDLGGERDDVVRVRKGALRVAARLGEVLDAVVERERQPR